jgi:galactokinase
VENLNKKTLTQLVDGSSISTLQTLRFDVEFLLKTDLATWEYSAKYQEIKAVVETLKVINDVAERAIALMTNYNESLTKNKESKQNLLHVVEGNRQRLVNVNKSTLTAYKMR